MIELAKASLAHIFELQKICRETYFLHFGDRWIENGLDLYLEKIYIYPAYIGKGIGKFALRELIKIVQQRSRKYLFLCVVDTNQGAISFYEKQGFIFHSKILLEEKYFKEELRRLYRMILDV